MDSCVLHVTFFYSLDSKSHLLEAMKAGFVRVVMFLCFILGMPGVGKTNLKCLLLNQDPPQQRTSTNCAEAPVRIEIRNVTGTKVQTTGGRWHDVDNEEMFDIIANMILVADPESRIEVDLMEEEAVHSKQPKTSNTFFSRIRNWMKRNSKPKNTDSNEEGATNVPHASPQPLPSNVSDACKSAMHVIMDKLVQCIMKAKGQMTMADISRIKQNLKLTWVYFTDSGGQPEYHELLPLFVRRISSAVCVIPLPSKLDETQDVEYFKNGQRIGDIQQSQFTEKDTVRCLFNTIESYSTQEEPPKVMVVGTYLDKLMELQQESAHAAVETDLQQKIASSDMLEDKDRQLREFLECDFPIQLVYYSESSTTKKLIFPVNTLSRAEHEKAVAESIRCSIESSGAMEENVPIWWYIMELLLQKLAEELRRGVLSRAECLQMASLLNITEDAFHDALVYFDKLNVLTYSPDVLPNVVFVESQIPLDKVSELVFHSYYLRQPTPAMSEEWRHFRDRGVVTMKCLEQFPRHYVQDIFSADDFCKFLQQRLVLAPIPKPESSSSEQVQEAASTTNDQPSSSTPAKKEPHYVMPALWSTLSEVELDSRRVSSPMAATLLVRFPRGFRRAGVFCCFTVHLIRYCGWDLLLETDQQLYRNCIKLRLLGSPPVTVVLIDSNSYIEVHVNTTTGIPIAEYAHLLPCIKNSILSGIFAACRALNYKQTKPHLTFYCPHTLPSASTDNSPKSKVQHTATLSRDRKYWRCDLDPDAYFGPLENQHAIWFGLPQGNYCLFLFTVQDQSNDVVIVLLYDTETNDVNFIYRILFCACVL